MRLYQTKEFLHIEGNNKMKRSPSEWKKKFEDNNSDRGIICKINKKHNSTTNLQITQLKNGQRIKNKQKKWAEDLNRHFS